MDEHLLGLAEIADLYAVSKATASNWSRSRDFPAPRWQLKMGPIWTYNQIERWRIPARTVHIDENTRAVDLPPAVILEVTVDRDKLPGYRTFGFIVRCPLCPKKHAHGASLGSRVPHCLIPHFGAQYNIEDRDGVYAAALAKYDDLRQKSAKKEDA